MTFIRYIPWVSDKIRTSKGVRIEARSWDGTATGLRAPDAFGGHTVNWPTGGLLVVIGKHYFETVTAAAGSSVAVQGWGRNDNVQENVASNAAIVTTPKDGWLENYANDIRINGKISASARGYGSRCQRRHHKRSFTFNRFWWRRRRRWRWRFGIAGCRRRRRGRRRLPQILRQATLTIGATAQILANGAGGRGGSCDDNCGSRIGGLGGDGASGGILFESMALTINSLGTNLSARGFSGNLTIGGTIKLFYTTLTGTKPTQAGRV